MTTGTQTTHPPTVTCQQTRKSAVLGERVASARCLIDDDLDVSPGPESASNAGASGAGPATDAPFAKEATATPTVTVTVTVKAATVPRAGPPELDQRVGWRRAILPK